MSPCLEKIKAKFEGVRVHSAQLCAKATALTVYAVYAAFVELVVRKFLIWVIAARGSNVTRGVGAGVRAAVT